MNFKNEVNSLMLYLLLREGSGAPACPGSLLEMQNLRLNAKPSESEPLLNEIPKGFKYCCQYLFLVSTHVQNWPVFPPL